MSLSALRASSSRLPAAAGIRSARTLFTHQPANGAAAPRHAAPGAVGGVDLRVLQGVPTFVGAEQMARVNEWQSGLWARLQDEVRNNPRLAPIRLKWDNDKLDMTDLLTFTAREPACALAFNYASLLLNNSYYLESINASTPQAIPENFTQLEDRVAAYADGIVGSGWLWIVKSGDSAQDVDVVPTFGAGTLLVTRRQQRGRESLQAVYGTPATSGDAAGAIQHDTQPAAAAPAADEAPEEDAAPTTRYPEQPPRFGANPNAPSEVVPLAVLSLFEHAYLGDKYGVASRKQYALDWFKALNWDKVQARAERFGAF